LSDNLDDSIREWADDQVKLMLGGYSGINAVERILRDPGIASQISQHKILWWPKTRRIARISRASHHLRPIDRIVLMVDAGVVMNKEGKPLEPKEFCEETKGSVRKYGAYVKRAKQRLREILRNIENLQIGA
jgi:hypothetical protein